MLIAGIIGICALLLVLAFLAPRLSSRPQRGVSRALGEGARAAAKAPGAAGRWLAKPFRTSSRAANGSASAGRRARAKLPL